MREIKFRVWQNGEMQYWPELPFNANVDLNEQIAEIQEWHIIMQYTGLKDCHGKEIYENDIINIRECNYVIVFSEKWGRYMAVDVDIINKWLEEGQPIREEYNIFGFDEDEAQYCVKTGNIYDNPELLGGD